jgi:hypothetical protein
MARQEIDAGRVEGAIPWLERSLQQDPRLWPACKDLARANALRGRVAETEATARRCRAIFPDIDLDLEELLDRAGRVPSRAR